MPKFSSDTSAWNSFKMDCARQVGQEQYLSENNHEYKGDVSSRINGSHGGPIGGEMVKRMIQQAETQYGGK